MITFKKPITEPLLENEILWQDGSFSVIYDKDKNRCYVKLENRKFENYCARANCTATEINNLLRQGHHILDINITSHNVTLIDYQMVPLAIYKDAAFLHNKKSRTYEKFNLTEEQVQKIIDIVNEKKLNGI